MQLSVSQNLFLFFRYVSDAKANMVAYGDLYVMDPKSEIRDILNYVPFYWNSPLFEYKMGWSWKKGQKIKKESFGGI